MGNMPGMAVIPTHYADHMVLYTATERVEAVVDGAPVGKAGRLFIIEVGKPTRVPYEAGRFILEHLGYTGVVRVEETEDDSGVHYDVQKGKAESLAASAEQDDMRFRRYISDAVEDFVKRNKPVPEPPEPILRIIERRGYDLKRFGIVPIGWEEPDKDKRLADLEAQLAALQAKLAKKEG